MHGHEFKFRDWEISCELKTDNSYLNFDCYRTYISFSIIVMQGLWPNICRTEGGLFVFFFFIDLFNEFSLELGAVWKL